MSANILTSETKPLIAVLAASLLIRSLVLLAFMGQLAADPDAYREIARNLATSGSYARDDGGARLPSPTAYRPPLYPFVLAAASLGDHTIPPLRVALLHLVLGTATVGLTYACGRRLSLPPWLATAGAILVACDPILLNQSTLAMTETLATLLTVAVWYAWLRFVSTPSWTTAAVVGGVLGLATLCRPTFLPWLALLCLAVLWLRDLIPSADKTRGLLHRGALALTMLIIAGLVLSPWTVRNYLQSGHPIATTTHGGYTLLLANNEGLFQYLRDDHSGLPWDQAKDAKFAARYGRGTIGSEVQVDDYHKQAAWAAIRSNPQSFCRACLYRVTHFWSPLPNKVAANESASRRALRYLTAGWYCAVYGLMFVGIAQLRRDLLRPAWLAGVLVCVAFVAVHTLYWTNLRMRAPLMPVVALVAAVGLGTLVRKVWSASKK